MDAATTRLVSLGRPDSVESLLRQAVVAGVPQWLGVCSLSVPDHLSEVAARAVALDNGAHWSWLWTTAPPALHPLEAQVVDLDDRRDAEQIAALSAERSRPLRAPSTPG